MLGLERSLGAELLEKYSLVLVGGKGTLGNTLCRIFGPHGLQISDRKHLIGSFNMHMSQCSFLFADEAYWPATKRAKAR
jgi:hypothetical protein